MASKKTEVQIQFEANTDNFSQGIKNANKSLYTLKNELKLNSTALKENGDNVELLSKRQSILQNEEIASASKVEALENKLQLAKETFGDNSDEVYRLTNQLLQAQNQLQGIQNDITQTAKRIDNLSDSFDDTNDSSSNTSGGFTIFKGALADLTSNVIQGAISAMGDLVSSFFDLSEATEEYRSMNAKLEGSASSFGYSVDFANEKYKEFYSYLGDSQMSTNAITNLMGLGLETENVSKLVDGAIGVWASYGDSIPIESLTESINETIQVGKVTGTFADTINWAKISNEDYSRILGEGSKAQNAFNKAIKDGESTEDAFSAALAATSDNQERANIVAGFLNSTYGESKTTYDSLTESIREANSEEADLLDVQSQMADAIDPINNAFTSLKTDALEAILPVVQDISQKFLDLKNYLSEHKTVATVLGAVITGLAVAFGVLAGALAIQGIINGVSAAFAFLNTTLLANPILLIVAAIAALIAIFVSLWNNCESFRQFWINLWNGIVGFLQGAVESIKNFFQGVIDFISNNWQTILSFIVNPFGTAFQLLYEKCEWFRNIVDGVKNKVVSIFTGLKDGVVNTITNLKNSIGNIFGKLTNLIATPINKARDLVKGAIDKIKGFFKFEFKWPKLKLPHFSVKPKGWEIGDLLKGKIPTLGITWNADGAIFTKPAILNSNNSGLQGVGEAGAEAILPINLLEEWITNTIMQSNMQMMNITNSNFRRLIEVAENILAKNNDMYVNGRLVSEALSNSNDQVSGELVSLKERGLAL